MQIVRYQKTHIVWIVNKYNFSVPLEDNHSQVVLLVQPEHLYPNLFDSWWMTLYNSQHEGPKSKYRYNLQRVNIYALNSTAKNKCVKVVSKSSFIPKHLNREIILITRIFIESNTSTSGSKVIVSKWLKNYSIHFSLFIAFDVYKSRFSYYKIKPC